MKDKALEWWRGLEPRTKWAICLIAAALILSIVFFGQPV